MPAKSIAQQRLMGADLARLRAGKKTVTGMSETQLKEFAVTRRKGLPARKSNPRHQKIANARLDNQRRYGNPRTDKERAKRHQARYGTTKLPPRGTRLRRER